MSTMGLYSQVSPSEDASTVLMRAARSIDSGFQVAASARGTGKVVRYPWMMSAPNRRGIPRRDSSTAIFCHAMSSSLSWRPNRLPTAPERTFSATPVLCCSPVTAPRGATRQFNCPSFSSRVICDISSSTLVFSGTQADRRNTAERNMDMPLIYYRMSM